MRAARPAPRDTSREETTKKGNSAGITDARHSSIPRRTVSAAPAASHSSAAASREIRITTSFLIPSPGKTYARRLRAIPGIGTGRGCISLYGKGVAAIPRLTKKLSQVGQDALERLELPVNLAKGVARIELLGNREVYMDRHCGVLAYTTENIDVNGGTVVVRFHGRELRLLVMTGQELRITGVIERIELVE